jgi:hypothetical protein
MHIFCEINALLPVMKLDVLGNAELLQSFISQMNVLWPMEHLMKSRYV